MAKMMKAARLLGPRNFVVTEEAIPVIEDDEVLVRVVLCGVCTYNLRNWLGGFSARKILGHEVVGVVAEVGSLVKGFKPGDRVTGMMLGGFAEYTKALPSLLVRIPDEVADEDAIMEPYSCLLSAAKRLPLDGAEAAAVVGVGFMGLGMVKLLKDYFGIPRVIAIGNRDAALAHARDVGATEAYLNSEVPDACIIDTWADDMFERGVPIVVEAAGVPETLDLALRMTAVHGTMSVVGYHASNGGMRNVNVQLANWKALEISNGHERRDWVHIQCQREILAAIAAGKMTTCDLITHWYSLDGLNQAYENIVHKPQDFIKSAIRFD